MALLSPTSQCDFICSLNPAANCIDNDALPGTIDMKIDILSPTFVRVCWHIELAESYTSVRMVTVIIETLDVTSKMSGPKTSITTDIGSGNHTLGPLQDGTRMYVRLIGLVALPAQLGGKRLCLSSNTMEASLPGELILEYAGYNYLLNVILKHCNRRHTTVFSFLKKNSLQPGL